jgi:GAF domain-containing protein
MIGTPDTPLSGDAFEHVSAAIAQGVPLEVALDLIMQRTCDLLEVHEAAFFLAEQPQATLRLTAASTGIPAQPVLLAPNEGVEGWVARRGRPIAVVNPSADPRFAPFRSWSHDLPSEAVLSIAAVPVRTGAAVVGVLSVIDLTESDPSGPTSYPLGAASIAELLPFLAILADLISLALENSDILRRPCAARNAARNSSSCSTLSQPFPRASPPRHLRTHSPTKSARSPRPRSPALCSTARRPTS